MTKKLPQICTVILLKSGLGRLRDLQYIFAVTSGSPSKKNAVGRILKYRNIFLCNLSCVSQRIIVFFFVRKLEIVIKKDKIS